MTTVVTIIIATVLIFVLAYKIQLSKISWGMYPLYNSSDGTAIEGYDPVAYQVSQQAIKGNPEITYSWKGINWHFSSVENQNLFQADPERYAPQYGGFCSKAAASGATFYGNPKVWYVQDKRLFLFVLQKAKDDFLKALDKGIIATADAHWEKRPQDKK